MIVLIVRGLTILHPAAPIRCQSRPCSLMDSRLRAEETLQGSLAHETHCRVAVDVVPDDAEGLLQRPGRAAGPFEIAAVKVNPQCLARAVIEQVPRCDEVESWVGRTQSADIDHAGQASVGHKYVAGDEVAMCRDVTARRRRQVA
jgi:hypothetical protein